jgi:hypothetical protein
MVFRFFHAFEYYDPVCKVSLNGRTRIITLELSKADKIVEKSIDEMSLPERWAVFFEYLMDRNRRAKINEILDKEEGVEMASQVLMTVSRDEEERARLMRDEKIELDYQSAMAYAMKTAVQTTEQKERQEFINLLKSGKSPEEILREYSST